MPCASKWMPTGKADQPGPPGPLAACSGLPCLALMPPPPRRVRSQLALQVPPELLEHLKARAAAEGRSHTSLALQWIRAGLETEPPSAGLPDLERRLAAVEAGLAALQRGRPPAAPVVAAVAPVAPAQPEPRASGPGPASAVALTTAELAERLGLRRATLNERLRRAGGARAGLVMEGWRCTGQLTGPNGGPPQWTWEPAG